MPVCELYQQNLIQINAKLGTHSHRIHPDLADELIFHAPAQWRLLDQADHALLYLRVYSFFQTGYRYLFNSYETIDFQRYWGF